MVSAKGENQFRDHLTPPYSVPSSHLFHDQNQFRVMRSTFPNILRVAQFAQKSTKSPHRVKFFSLFCAQIVNLLIKK